MQELYYHIKPRNNIIETQMLNNFIVNACNQEINCWNLESYVSMKTLETIKDYINVHLCTVYVIREGNRRLTNLRSYLRRRVS